MLCCVIHKSWEHKVIERVHFFADDVDLTPHFSKAPSTFDPIKCYSRFFQPFFRLPFISNRKYLTIYSTINGISSKVIRARIFRSKKQYWIFFCVCIGICICLLFLFFVRFVCNCFRWFRFWCVQSNGHAGPQKKVIVNQSNHIVASCEFGTAWAKNINADGFRFRRGERPNEWQARKKSQTKRRQKLKWLYLRMRWQTNCVPIIDRPGARRTMENKMKLIFGTFLAIFANNSLDFSSIYCRATIARSPFFARSF